MKHLSLLLSVLAFGASVHAVQSVSVNIDGVNYTCSAGGGPAGNQCNCVIGANASYCGSLPIYSIYKRGVLIGGSPDNVCYPDNPTAQSTCQQTILQMPSCYQ